ncbi:MAG TPA: PBP1A family penicillin-binding protein, partial [Stellaceae bacterium]|nr:PBP1A family penicillin-binding protein [Stellaceae bacterium]
GSKIYAADGSLMTEFETEHRIPVAIDKVPRLVIEAFLAAEDRDFYSHGGVDPLAMVRAALTDILRLERGQRPIGASTIAQQVVRHFLLTNEVSISRKIKEVLLAYRIERTLSKDRILEIYLNETYLGAGAYGVAAAADTYFQKPLDQLSLAQAAFLAALPKAPNNYNPIRHPAAAKARRDWVLSGMAEVGWISAAQAKLAEAEPLVVHLRKEPQGGQDGYFADEVRRELIGRFGEKAVYEGGLSVHTSYTPSDQQMAETAFRHGLTEYDRRHGWRGPLAHDPTAAAARAALAGMADPPGTANWQLAAVTATDFGGATIALKNGGVGRIPLAELRWARRTLKDQRLGAPVRSAREVLDPGDIVLVEPLPATPPARWHRRAAVAPPNYALRQLPDVSGGLVSMDPKTGRILALVGGWSFRQSQFDRAIQAKRQPGSAFKPFVYVTALENGFTPSSMVDDSPISIPQGPGLSDWQPVNYEGGYVGQTTLDDALVHSRNLATVHVAMTIGLPAIAKTVRAFDVMDNMPPYYSMALGAGETTLLRLTGAYAMLDNAGHWLSPSVIDLVQDRNGHILYQKGIAGCTACFVASGASAGADVGGLYRPAGPADPATAALPNVAFAANAVLYKPTKRDPLVDRNADDELISMMQGVVQRGTGIAVSAVGKPLAGKTGTTSDWFDAWFVGFSPGLAAGVFVGFDEPRTLGDGEAGGRVAAPIFRDFMSAALKNQPATPFPLPASTAATVASKEPDDNSSAQDAASLDDDTQDSGRVSADDRADAGDDRADRVSPDADMPEAPARQWRGYAAPGTRSYAAARTPYIEAPSAPYAAAQGYAVPLPGYPLPPPPMPGTRTLPRHGTGGLY